MLQGFGHFSLDKGCLIALLKEMFDHRQECQGNAGRAVRLDQSGDLTTKSWSAAKGVCWDDGAHLKMHIKACLQAHHADKPKS